MVNNVPVENNIGDALVHRIVRAHREGTNWRCCIVIPLIPGFPYPIDHSDASAVRIIVECQNRTLFRGPHSIYARLRKEGIDPEEYISVFSLRNWAKLPGNVLTTEMVYIHGKVCIIDDRLAIIGSANINDRSQRGDRDSELAAFIRDTDYVESFMDGKPYKVGKFAHTLRVRLMREHLGVDVDAMYEEDLMANEPIKPEMDMEAWDPDHEQQRGAEHATKAGRTTRRTGLGELFKEVKDGASQALHAEDTAFAKGFGKDLHKVGVKAGKSKGMADVEQIQGERMTFTHEGEEVPGFASSQVPTMEEKMILEHRPPSSQAEEKPILDSGIVTRDASTSNGGPPEAKVSDGSGEKFGAPADASKDAQTDDEPPHARSGETDATKEDEAAVAARKVVRQHLTAPLGSKYWTLPTPGPDVDPHGFQDPVCDKFWKNVWVASAVHNTEIYRKVFHSIPDDSVTTWKQYKEFVMHHERLNKPAKEKGQTTPEPVARLPSEAGDENALGQEKGSTGKAGVDVQGDNKTAEAEVSSSSEAPAQQHGEGSSSGGDDKSRIPAKGDEPFELWEREEMERLLEDLRGHVVIYPTRFMEGEDVINNFLFNADRILPMPIYN